MKVGMYKERPKATLIAFFNIRRIINFECMYSCSPNGDRTVFCWRSDSALSVWDPNSTRTAGCSTSDSALIFVEKTFQSCSTHSLAPMFPVAKFRGGAQKYIKKTYFVIVLHSSLLVHPRLLFRFP